MGFVNRSICICDFMHNFFSLKKINAVIPIYFVKSVDYYSKVVYNIHVNTHLHKLVFFFKI